MTYSWGMNQSVHTPVDEPACPIGIVVLPALIGSLVWLVVLLSQLPQ